MEATYVYDTCVNGKGRLCSVTNSASVESREYNSLGLTSKETKTISSVNYITQYTYDRQGNQTLITNPDSSQVKYLYNTAGQLEQVQRKESTDAGFINVVTNFNYSPMEQPTTISYANGATTTNTYDSTKLYRMTAKVTTIAGSSHAQDLAYTYDANGNITRTIDASATSTSKIGNYVYDPLNRLTSAAITNVASGQSPYTETYAYDAIGNITSKNGQAYTYSQANYTNPHAVTSIGSTTFTYDNNGNELTKGTSLTNTWDYNNRLTQSVVGSTTVTYAYDAEGQRIKYSKGTTTSYYPSKYYNTDGATRKKHIFANGIEIGVVTGTGSSATVRYIHTDHLTGSNIITNSSNTADETLDYYPFGGIRIDSGSFNEQRKFTGYEYDGDTGFNYAGSRYYDASTGRFISQDPLVVKNPEKVLGDPQSLNYYAYSRNNPLRYIDPTGESWQEFFEKVARTNSNIVTAVVPYVSDIRDAFELNTGRDLISNQRLTQGQTELTGLGLFIPLAISGKEIRTANIAAKELDAGTSRLISAGEKNYATYVSFDKLGKIDYVGITNDFTRRAGEHLRNVGREIEKMRGLPELTKNQARGIEQVLTPGAERAEREVPTPSGWG